MKIEGIDRVVLVVKDMDKAVELVSKLLEIDFEEERGPLLDEVGIRVSVGYHKKTKLLVEMMQPVYPLKDVKPPDPIAMAKAVEHVDAAVWAIAFRVKDTEESAADLESKGIRVVHKVEMPQGPIGITNWVELITNKEDTLGVNMAFVSYKEPTEK